MTYRGRIAPSPTGYLHLGHARTFWMAQARAQAAKGTLILRNEDLDRSRCRPEFVQSFYDDLRWFGFDWQEGPDIGGPFAPYSQSERMEPYRSAFQQLVDRRLVYPCICSRLDVQRALQAPHQGEEEPLYPGTCRDRTEASGGRINWRFRVPDGEAIAFEDGQFGPQSFMAGRDFGDFVVWRQEGLPSYQLAVVVDDASMQITEVVRGADLLLSTARQILLYRALGWPLPAFYHCPLMLDDQGKRLAKRVDSLSLRHFRAEGISPEELRNQWHQSTPQPCTH
jgi:glutamyl-tRNA synthetase